MFFVNFGIVCLALLVGAEGKRSRSPCLVGQDCFPSKRVLDSFNQTLSGALHQERPIAAACYKSDALYDEAECSRLTNVSSSGNFRTSHFPTYVFNNWEECNKDSCPFPTVDSNIQIDAVCKQGNIPTYAVHARNEEDVLEYVRFIKRQNLVPVVKNTGHDLLGRSSGYSGVAVWTHGLNNKTFHESFVPQGCAEKDVYSGAISLGAGVQWYEAYSFAAEHRVHIVGGASTTVGAAGGYLQGGGHSYLTPSYGLAVDNLIEMEIVTPDGMLRKISKCSDPDLFWAVRGGGGGTWGVTTQVTYKTRPETQLFQVQFVTDPNASISVFNKTLERYIELSPILAKHGIGGAGTLNSSSLSMNLVVPNTSISFDKFQNILTPFGTFLETNSAISTSFGSLFKNWTNFQEFFESMTGTDHDSAAGYSNGNGTTSRVLPRHVFKSPASRHLTRIFLDSLARARNSNLTSSSVIGLATPVSENWNNHTSLNPAWYDSIWHVVNLGDMADELRDLTPAAAVYLGETNAEEPNYQNAYWGEKNYGALQRIKRKYDPSNLFTVFHGVGFEEDQDKWRCYGG